MMAGSNLTSGHVLDRFRQQNRLLIVDDDPLIADALGYFLGRDYAVTTASTRAEAVAALRGGKSSRRWP
jgi:ActR/RegA family two-component response regulator